MFKMIQELLKRLDFLDIVACQNERRILNLTVQAANLSLKDDLASVQKAYEQLTAIEASEDLCEVLSFRNHMMFNRIVSVVLAKLQDCEQSPCLAYGGLTPE